MSTITIPNVFAANTVIDPTQMNANFTAITAVVNGALDNTNISSAAAIALSKLALAPGSAAFNKNTTGAQTWGSGLTTDTQPQIAMTSDTGLQFGPGGATVMDTALIRSAATTLKLQAVGGAAATLDHNGGAIINAASIALKNTNSATITPAAMGAARAITLPDPGASAKLYCGATSLANHQVLTFDGSLIQGVAPGANGKLLRSNGTDWLAVAPYQSADQTITQPVRLFIHSSRYREPIAVSAR